MKATEPGGSYRGENEINEGMDFLLLNKWLISDLQTTAAAFYSLLSCGHAFAWSCTRLLEKRLKKEAKPDQCGYSSRC